MLVAFFKGGNALNITAFVISIILMAIMIATYVFVYLSSEYFDTVYLTMAPYLLVTSLNVAYFYIAVFKGGDRHRAST